MKNIFSKFTNNKILASKMLGSSEEVTKSLEYFISQKIKTINGLILRKGSRELIGILLKYIRGVRPRSSKSVVRQVAGFVFFCKKMAMHNGLKGLVIYLKASQVILQQSVGGFRVQDLGELKVRPSRNRAGVPLIIPAGVRVLITRDRDVPTIKLWMTLLGLYRILDFRGVLSFDTITQKGVKLSKSFMTEWEDYISNHFVPNLKHEFGNLPKLKKMSVYPILKTGPTSPKAESELDSTKDVSLANSHAAALITAARLLIKSKPLMASFERVSEELGFPSLIARVRTVAMAEPIYDWAGSPIAKNSKWFFASNVKTLDDLIPKATLSRELEKEYDHDSQWSLKVELEKNHKKTYHFLGKLGLKPEPAGKIRVFAMVDAWTQWLLAPLHKWIFSIIERIPQDGTFDQLSPITELQAKYALNPRKRTFGSIDLSAATDRLPITLQIIVLRQLLKGIVPDSASFAKNWADLLVKRPYEVSLLNPDLDKKAHVPKKVISKYPKLGGRPLVYYAVGQPMGALSSWAMLAITHHAMMQFAYYKATGKTDWFRDYGVLGDDGAIANGKVITAYRELLAQIGVKAGLAKSILAKSKFVMEFAKKFFVDNVQANMLPIKECIATSASTGLVLEFARKYELNLNQVLSFVGYGYKTKMRAVHSTYWNLSNRLRVLLVWLSHPTSPLGKSTYIEWLSQKSWTDLHKPSPKALYLIRIKLVDLCLWKIDKILELYKDYLESIVKTVDNHMDKSYPISITALISSSSSDLGYQRNAIPWRAVVNPDLSNDPNQEFEFLTGGMSVHNYRFQQLKKVTLGIPFSEVQSFMDILPIIYDARLGDEDKIELLLDWYYKPDSVTSNIAKEFWGSQKEELRPFHEFSEIFRLWKDLTKPIWKEYYISIKDTTKLKNFEEPEIKVNTLDLPDRGDPEGSATTYLQSLKSLKWILSAVKICLKIFNFVLELLIAAFLMILFVSYVDINSPEDNLQTIAVDPQIVMDYSPNIAIWGMAVGLAIILGSISLSLWMTGSIWPAIIPGYELETILPIINVPDMIQGHSLGISGPLTLDEYQVLQRALETQALLDNLSISPIGDLWISPWT